MNTEYDIYKIMRYIKDWAWIIITATLVLAIVSVVSTELLQNDEYRSEAQLIVNQRSNQDAIQLNEIQTNVSLIDTYRQIIMGKSVLDRVIAQSDNYLTITTLRNAIEITQTADAQTFNIVATLDSPELAQEVVTSVIDIFNETLRDIYGTDVLNVYVLSAPSFEPEQIKTSLFYRAIIGGLTGTLISILVLFLREMLDTSVKDEDFIRQFGLVKLGELESLSDTDYTENILGFVKKGSKSRKVI